MTRFALLLLLVVVASACAGREAERPAPHQQGAVRAASDSYDWPADGVRLVRTIIKTEWKGGIREVSCGGLNGRRGICHATWKKLNGNLCTGEFTLYVNGDYMLDGSDPQLVSCTEGGNT